MKLHDPGFTTGWIAVPSANRTPRLASPGLYLCNAMILRCNLALVVKRTSVQCFKTDPDVSKKDPHVCALGSDSCCGSRSLKRCGKGLRSLEAQGSSWHQWGGQYMPPF